MNNEKQPESLSTLWEERIKSWHKTDLNQSVYCHQHNLNYHRFTYWRRKLAGQTTKKRKIVQHSAFVSVKTRTPLTIPDLSLTLSNGAIVQGITSSNLLVVKQLLILLS
jgi:hypothetical protein